MTAARQIVDWAWSLQPGCIPASAAAACGEHLLDGLGCAAAAARTGAAWPAVELASMYTAPAESTVLGTTTAVPAPYAALANGALVHALDFDDTHPGALVHATAAVLPALLAVGERVGANGQEILLAAAAGYETVIRLGAAVPHGFHAKGFHATSVCGVFAAALVAAKLMGLAPDQAVNALGIAGSTAAGSLEFLSDGSDTKQLHPGMAALAGINAADLARRGASGPASILEGEHGLYLSYLGRAVDGRELTATLGDAWEVVNIGFKRYPCCQLNSASLDALGGLLPLDPADIERLVVHLPSASMPIVADPAEQKAAPRTPYEAKFSVQWCLAAMALDGAVGVDTFAQITRTDVAAMAQRVRVVAVPTDQPPASFPGHVEVALMARASLLGEAPAATELTTPEVLAKFATNAGGTADAQSLAAEVLNFAGATSITPLLRRLGAITLAAAA